jgi:DNA-binding CsgD family transcriptional regulator
MEQHEFVEIFEGLTARRKQLLRLVLAGLSDEEIASEVGIREASVRKYLERFYRTFQIGKRYELVALAANYMPELIGNRSTQLKFLSHNTTIIQLESHPDFYIERPPVEEICHEELSKAGGMLRIKAPRKFGKTFLLNSKIVEFAHISGFQTVILSFDLAEQTIFDDLDTFLKWFCANVTRQLELEVKLDDRWDSEIVGSKANCKYYFEDYLLSQIATPLVLALDAVDLVFHHSDIARDFLSMLRGWHEAAHREDLWQKLRLVLAYSTAVRMPSDVNLSRLNVGMPIRLPEFTPLQVQDLAQRYALKWDSEQIEKFMQVVGGHPYLVRILLQHISKQEIAIEKLLPFALTEERIYEHLKQHDEDLASKPELRAELKKAVEAQESVQLELDLAHELEDLGLVRLENNKATISCELYRQYFHQRFQNN